MDDIGTGPIILWDTLKLSAELLPSRSDILVVADVKVQERGQTRSDEYRINFELNRHHGLVSYDAEVKEPTGAGWSSLEVFRATRCVVAIKNRFLTTHLYSHVTGQLGWIPAPSVELVDASLDP
jgi:hypothetical protein